MAAVKGNAGLGELYSEAILEHARRPQHESSVKNPESTGDAINPFCGDEAHFQLSVSNKVINNVGMQTVGCSITRAAGSILAEALLSAPIHVAKHLVADYRALMAGQCLVDDKKAALGELRLMESVRQFPVRIKCALLALTAVEEALSRYQ